MAKKLSPMEQKASSKVLDALRGETQKMLKGKMDGIKKVTVASDSKEGLAKGLDLAKKIAGKSPEDSHERDLKHLMSGHAEEEADESPEKESLESPEEESLESPEEEASEQEDGSECSPEEEAMDADQLQKRIEALMSLKSKKQ